MASSADFQRGSPQVGVVGDEGTGLFRFLHRVKDGGFFRVLGEGDRTKVENPGVLIGRFTQVAFLKAYVGGEAVAVKGKLPVAAGEKGYKGQGGGIIGSEHQVLSTDTGVFEGFLAAEAEYVVSDFAHKGAVKPQLCHHACHVGGSAAGVRLVEGGAVVRHIGGEINQHFTDTDQNQTWFSPIRRCARRHVF